MKMRIKLKPMIIGLAVVMMGVCTYLATQFYQDLPTGTGYTAKYLCSNLFLSGRKEDVARIIREEIEPIHPSFGWIKTSVDYENKTVSSSGIAGLKSVTAVYRDGLGCTLNIGISAEELYSQAVGIKPKDKPVLRAEWPLGEGFTPNLYANVFDQGKLNAALDEAFKEPTPQSRRNTRAIVVIHQGKLVAERYAQGFDADMPLLGWSMAKSVTNAMTGVLVKAGKLTLDAPAPVAEWQGVDDPRKQISLDQLLRMSSGLAFSEIYTPGSDASEMLFNQSASAAFAANKSLQYQPDEHWSYSSGTTNIISRIIKESVGGKLDDYYRFSREELFDRIGMHSATFEPDPSGSFVGSSYLFATARDWARFGLLFLNDGVWQGQRILPEGWVKYSTTPTAAAPLGQYGAQFWLNAGEADDINKRGYPRLPADMFGASGFTGQSVTIFPSQQLVVVRLGTTLDDSWDKGAFLADVLSAF